MSWPLFWLIAFVVAFGSFVVISLAIAVRGVGEDPRAVPGARGGATRPAVLRKAEEIHGVYVLRFVQRFRAGDEPAFMALEAQFAALERRKGWPQGRRSRPFAGREPANTLIWEGELATLAEVNEALATLGRDPDHARLLKQQIPYFLEAWTEVYEVLELPKARRVRGQRSS